MRRLLELSLIVALVASLVAFSGGKEDEGAVNDTCNREESVQKCKDDLVPFRYSGVRTTHITSKPYDQVEEIAIPMYYDTQYRFVFNLEGLKPNIKVEIYDKSVRDDSRELIFESSSKHFKFEPDPEMELNRLYINYVVPPVEVKDGDPEEKGCVVLTTGYKNV